MFGACGLRGLVGSGFGISASEVSPGRPGVIGLVAVLRSP